MFTYFNSKMSLIEHHMQDQLQSLYKNIIQNMCQLEKTLLETRLVLARLNPTEFASQLMKSQGYTAVVAGEVLYVIQCKIVYVTIQHQTTCYQEIPVSYNGDLRYLGAVTRVLQRHGTEIECTPLLSAKFHFGSKWYSMDGRLREVPNPETLSSDLDNKWSFDNLPNLMSSGLYDNDSVSKMKEMIYENDDRRSASVVVHRTLSGFPSDSRGFDFKHIITDNLIESSITEYWNKLTTMTSWLGSITSSILGIWMICKVIKFLIDTDIYGVSWRLVASFWDSLTGLLSHKYHHRREREWKNNISNDNDHKCNLNESHSNTLYPLLVTASAPTTDEVKVQTLPTNRVLFRYDP
jgi:hypothetical protein